MIKPQFEHFDSKSNSSQQKCGDLGSSLPKFRPQYLAPDRDPRAADKSQNISETHGRTFRTGTRELRWKPPENSIEQPARRRDARACRGEARRGGNEPLVLEGDEGEGLGLHLPQRRPPSAAPTLPTPPSLLVCLVGRGRWRGVSGESRDVGLCCWRMAGKSDAPRSVRVWE